MITQNLDTIVREYILLGEGKESLHKYNYYLQAAIKGLKEMHYDVSGVPQVSILEVEDGGRATLPQNTIRVIRVGFLGSDGRFIEIFLDNNLAINLQGQYSCDDGDATITYLDAGTPIAPTQSDMTSIFRNGQIIGGQYGNVGGGIYTYRMDWDRGVLEFSSNISGQVVLEYLGDPTKIDEQYLVHPFLVEPIQAFIYYAMIRFKKSVSLQEKNEAFRQYVLKKRHAQSRFSSESMGNIINASRKTFSLAPKY